MATIKRVSPLKPGLRGARNWMTAQVRTAQYSRGRMIRFIASLVFLLASIVFLSLWLAGLLPNAQKSGQDFVKNRLVSMGFVVEHVDVIGEGAISESDVKRALAVSPGDYLFEANLEQAQNRIEDITWVERAIVRRLWPDRIVVQIIERKPFALWQNNGQFYLVDDKGGIISAASIDAHPDLQLIVGPDAPLHYANFKKDLDAFPGITNRISALVRHNTRRWDVIVDDGALRVKLPEKHYKASLTRLQRLQQSHRILDRDISVIDLRLSDRISLMARSEKPA